MERGNIITQTSKIMAEACEANGIPCEIFIEAIVVNYRSLKLRYPEVVSEIESTCDEVDRKMKARQQQQ